MTLTAKQIESAKPREKSYKLGDSEGLYLFVSPTGAKSWRANYYAPNPDGGKLKQKTRTYGQYPQLSLSIARDRHRAARGRPAVGEAASGKPPFETVAQQWMDKHLPGLTNPKHRAQVENTLQRFAFPRLGKLPIDKIPRTLLVETVQSVQKKPAGENGDDRVETAHRVAGRIAAVFDYAQDIGLIEAHPAARLTRVLQARKTKTPMATVKAEEAGQLLRDILTYPEPTTRLALMLAVRTFVRVQELLGFEKDELREDGAVWVVPAERMKMDLPHVVPLSKQSQGLVTKLSLMSGCGLVIESTEKPGRQLSENTLLFALYRLGYRGRQTVHGFRALASTVLNEQSGFDKDVIERQLAHQERDDVRAAYNRAEYLDQRRVLMQWWSDWLDAQTAAR